MNNKIRLILIRKDELLSMDVLRDISSNDKPTTSRSFSAPLPEKPFKTSLMSRSQSICTSVLNKKRFKTLAEMKSLAGVDDSEHRFLVGTLTVHSPCFSALKSNAQFDQGLSSSSGAHPFSLTTF